MNRLILRIAFNAMLPIALYILCSWMTNFNQPYTLPVFYGSMCLLRWLLPKKVRLWSWLVLPALVLSFALFDSSAWHHGLVFMSTGILMFIVDLCTSKKSLLRYGLSTVVLALCTLVVYPNWFGFRDRTKRETVALTELEQEIIYQLRHTELNHDEPIFVEFYNSTCNACFKSMAEIDAWRSGKEVKGQFVSMRVPFAKEQWERDVSADKLPFIDVVADKNTDYFQSFGVKYPTHVVLEQGEVIFIGLLRANPSTTLTETYVGDYML